MLKHNNIQVESDAFRYTAIKRTQYVQRQILTQNNITCTVHVESHPDTRHTILKYQCIVTYIIQYRCTGADLGFQVRGAHLKKLRRAEGGANIFGVFRVKKNHDFTQNNHIFSNFRGARAGCAPPLNPPLVQTVILTYLIFFTLQM